MSYKKYRIFQLPYFSVITPARNFVFRHDNALFLDCGRATFDIYYFDSLENEIQRYFRVLGRTGREMSKGTGFGSKQTRRLEEMEIANENRHSSDVAIARLRVRSLQK